MPTDVQLFADGYHRRGGAGQLRVTDPGTGRRLGVVELASEADVRYALSVAHRAFPGWSATPPAERGAVLKRAADTLLALAGRAASALVAELGRTRAEARREITRAIEELRHTGEQAVQLPAGARSFPAPLGVVAVVTPWYSPVVPAARHLAAAVAAGCPVVLNAAVNAPSAAALVVQALAEAGVPDGVVNLVFGDAPAVSEQLLRSPVVHAVAVSGPATAARSLAEPAARRLIRCVVDLDGHTPVLAGEDADPAAVVAVTGSAAFACAGQSGAAPSRYLVPRDLHDAFADALSTFARSLQLGSARDPATTLGPVAGPARLDTLVRSTGELVARGARLATGGARADGKGFFFQPTVLAGVDPAAEVPFGPLVTVTPYDGFDEALSLVEAGGWVPAVALFTDSGARRERAVAMLPAGSIGINRLPAEPPTTARERILEFTRPRRVVIT
ncbi:aldehyde dehydrogenase family protein [Amycolatopsis sp. NPDC051903]|uniref:aldehyde dehydrogenase family protein n=1 Tax=Amycolatopsis sp. NPDC051903 TaxID=3363936 RepID=UPI00379B8240